jgi:hypothetical protein
VAEAAEATMSNPAQPADAAGDPAIILGLACLKTGLVLEVFGGNRERGPEELAAAAPSLFESADAADWRAIFQRMGGGDGSGFQDIVIVGKERVHVVQRLERRPETAIVAVGSGTTNVGLVLSSVRSLALELEPR